MTPEIREKIRSRVASGTADMWDAAVLWQHIEALEAAPAGGTEQTLRAALQDVMAQLCGQSKSCGHDYHCICPGNAARAALALRVPEVTLQYRVAYVRAGESRRMAATNLDDARNLAECLDGKVVIESREIHTGPWLPVVQP